jgi:hypothetical protein
MCSYIWGGGKVGVGVGGFEGIVFLPLSLCSNPNRQELGQPRPVTPAGSAQPINQTQLKSVLRIRIRDLGWGKIRIRDPHPGSGMNIPDNFSNSLETVFGLKILKFFVSCLDLGSRIRDLGWKTWIRDPVYKHPGTATPAETMV